MGDADRFFRGGSPKGVILHEKGEYLEIIDV